MSIQTSVYIGGFWTTIVMDINHVIAQNRGNRNQEKSSSVPPMPNNPQPPPSLGILTQTVIRSPVVKRIIPARIRHESKNDVVFVYDNYIEIKEIFQDGNGFMRTAAVKMDFDSSIRSARVLGLPRRYDDYNNTDAEGIDVLMKEESQDLHVRTPHSSPRVPPQVLVMTLDCKKLVFTFAFHNAQGIIEFISYQRPLPFEQHIHKQPGENIAVDPKSRAMAVAAFEGKLILYALETMDDVRKQVEVAGEIQGAKFQPIKEELHIDVEGIILKMEFLHPPESIQNKNQVILLLVVNQNRESRLVCYEWDCSASLDTYNMVGNPARKGAGQKLHVDDEIPLLLVPLTKSAAFLLVSEKRMTVYRDILTGWAKAFTIPSDREDPEEPGSSKQPPLWIQWARPMRTEAHTKKQDNIYLCREDGVVQFMDISENSGSLFQTIHPVGKLGVNINTSFATLDMGLERSDDQFASADVLLAGGDMSDGGRWSFGARNDANKLEVIRNWTPLVDLAAKDSTTAFGGVSGHAEHAASSEQSQTRFFASTGRGLKSGNITEIRYGIEAIRKGTLDLEAGITQAWVLNDVDGGNFALFSYPMQTSLLRIRHTADDVDLVDSTYYNIEYEAMTIAAGISMTGVMVQVTRNSVTAALPGTQTEPFQRQGNILAAHVGSIRDNDSQMDLLMAVRERDHIFVNFGRIDSSGYIPMGLAASLTSEPVSVHLEYIGGDYYAFVGTVASTLQIYCVDPISGLTPAFEYGFNGEFAICASIAILTMQSDSKIEHLIVCGLREGSVEVLHLDPNSPDQLLSFRERLQIGNTTVTVSTDNTRISRAIILSEQKLYSLEYSPDRLPKSKVPASLNSIWLTDSEHTFQQGEITAFAQGGSGISQGLLFCVEGSQIHMARFFPQTQPESGMIPRRIPIPGTPVRLIYSQWLKRLVVIYYQINIIKAEGRRTAANQRSTRYHMAVVDPDAAFGGPDEDGNEETRPRYPSYYSKPGERFLGVTEWFPKVGEDVHHLFLVHTILGRRVASESKGRILLFAASEKGSMTLKRHYDKDSPVYSLAPYEPSSILYCCGHDLCLQSLDTSVGPSSVKMADPIVYDLKTRGLYISTHKDWIYVTTDGNGLNVFKLEDSTLVRYFTSERAWEGLHHLAVPEHSLVLTSQRDRTIAGVWQPPERRANKNHTSTVFVATLPGSITRFARIRKRPWQRPASSSPDTVAALDDPFIGTSTNGAIYQFQILKEPAWRLLRFIQNMAMHHIGICPFLDFSEIEDRNLDPSPVHDSHVDGDILRRLLEGGPEKLLAELLQRPLYNAVSFVLDEYKPRSREGFGSPPTRKKVFAELAAAAGVAKRGGDEEEEEEELITQVVRWVGAKLEVAL